MITGIESSLQERVARLFSQIPGCYEVYHAGSRNVDALSQQYPEAYFAVYVVSNLFQHDRELSHAYQEAFFGMERGENIESVKHSLSKAIQRFVDRHNWDD